MRAIELLDLDVLTEPELEDQIAAGPQAARRVGDQPRDEVEARRVPPNSATAGS